MPAGQRSRNLADSLPTTLQSLERRLPWFLSWIGEIVHLTGAMGRAWQRL